MPTLEVIARVRELHSELSETQPDAPHLVEEHQELARAVDAVMLDPKQVHLYTSLNDRLLLAYVKFELDHPKLAAAMQNVMSSLAAAGI